MRFELATILALFASVAFCDGAQPSADEQEQREDPELEAEIAYVNALVDRNYVDIVQPVIEATKRRWPESDARFFAIEIRSLLALNQFDEAEKKLASLPDRNSAKYWAARLEFANRYSRLNKMEDCRAIYAEFFGVYDSKAAKDKAWAKQMRTFYVNACYAWGQILVLDHNLAEAIKVYGGLLAQKPGLESAQWCTVACDTIDLHLRLATAQADVAKRKPNLDAADKLADEVLKNPDQAICFGRAVNMKSHIELLRGRPDRAKGLIDDYLPQLGELHASIVSRDPDGSKGLLRFSPMPQCRYLLAKMLWDEAQAEAAKPKPDAEAVKALLFGEKLKSGKRDNQGAYNHALNVFLRFPESSWASKAGELADAIKDFAERKYGAKIKSQVTPEMVAKVRAIQFKIPADKRADGEFEEAFKEYLDVLSRYPETEDSVLAIESMVGCCHDLIRAGGARADEWRLNADAIEGYLAERFAGAKDRLVMITAGDAVLRLAKAEKELGQISRCADLRRAFVVNYRNHSNAAQTAAGMATEAQQAGRFAEAIGYWDLIGAYYTNSVYYASSFAQASVCHKELGDRAAAIAAMMRYTALESNAMQRLQSQMVLAQMYRDDGIEMLNGADTNATPEAVEAQEKRGTAQLIRAIRQFGEISKDSAARAKEASISREDAAKYVELADTAGFVVGECWSRMNRPSDRVPGYRAQALKSYEAYLAAFPKGKYAKAGYVRVSTLYTASGDLEKSRAALDALSRQFPDSSEAKDAKPRLAKSLMEIGLKKEGTEIYAEMLSTDGAYSAQQYVNAGEALVEARNWSLAGQAFHKAISIAGTNQAGVVAKAMIGQARSAWKQGSLTEAREIIDRFLADARMAKMSLAAEANFMLVDVASAQGAVEKDETLRNSYFGAAIGALKKVRQYWARSKPQWEQDQLDLLSGDVMVNRMKAEEAMGLKENALDTCARAASTFQAFIQAHGVDDEHPIDKMEAGELANLERAYATMIPLFSKMGSEQADRVIRFGQDYLDYFPNGKARTEIANCINQAKAELPAKEKKQ